MFFNEDLLFGAPFAGGNVSTTTTTTFTSQVITERTASVPKTPSTENAASTEKTASTPKTTSETPMVPESNSNGGSTYVRWGRTVCPESSSLVYAGMF